MSCDVGWLVLSESTACIIMGLVFFGNMVYIWAILRLWYGKFHICLMVMMESTEVSAGLVDRSEFSSAHNYPGGCR